MKQLATTSTISIKGWIKYGAWWCVAKVDNEVCRYYRALFNKNRHISDQIQPQKEDGHITIVSKYDRCVDNNLLWGKYNNKFVDFELDLYPLDNGRDYWLRAYSYFAEDIREEMGLNREPYYPLHLTIGNRKGNVRCYFKNSKKRS